MSSTISALVGGASCDSMNRSTSRRSMASGECPYLWVIAQAAAGQLQPGSSVLLPASGASRLRLPLRSPGAVDRNATAHGRSGPRSPAPARRCAARASAPRCARHAPDRVHPGNSLPDDSQQVDLAVHTPAQQRRTAIAGHLAGGKTCLHTARKMGCKSERFLVTTLSSQRPPPLGTNYASTTQLCHEKTAFPSPFLNPLNPTSISLVRNPG